MAPKRSTKAKEGMAQPMLSFQHRKPNAGGKKKKTASSASLAQQSSISSIDEERKPHSPEITATEPTPLAEGARGTKRRLNVKDKRWEGVRKAAHAEMGYMKPIHATPETHDDIHHVLRVFDLTAKYGPCVGITRLQRWERAKRWGLNPPEEIKEILTTQEGEDDPSYRENVLHAWLG